MEHWRNTGLIFCGLLIALALLLPSQALAESLSHGDIERLPDLVRGTVLLRVSLVGVAGVLLALILMPGWFAGPGIPSQVAGLFTRGGKEDGLSSGWTSRTKLIVLALVLVGLFLRLFKLGGDLWLDEIPMLSNFARWPLADTVTQFSGANQHLLYAALANVSVSLFGATEAAVRLPSAILGAASIFALYFLARLITNKQEALWATALMTFSYHHIWFSQNARGWMGMLFFTLLGTGLFLYGLVHNRSRIWLLYSVVMALGIFVHLNTLFIFLGHLSAYLLVLPRWPGWRQAHWPLTRCLIWVGFLTGFLSILFYSFILPQMVTYFLTAERTTAAVGWTNPLALLAQVAQGLAAGFLGLGAVVLGLIALLGLVSYWKQSWLVVGMLVLPAGFNVLAVFAMRVGTYPRHFFYMLPLALIIAVRGAYSAVDLISSLLARIFASRGSAIQKVRQYGAPVLLSLVLIASLISLIPYYQTPKQDYRGALAFVEENQGPEDVVAAVGLAASGYRGLYGPQLAFPETAEELAALEDDGQVVWVIFTFPRDMRIRFGDLFDYIQDHYQRQAVFPGTVGDGDIYVLKRTPN